MPSKPSEKRDKSQQSAVQAAAEAMRAHGLSYPGTHEDFPWEDHRALKVKGKAFVFMGMGSDELNFSVKLPQSKDIALMLPFATPTGYGLGKSGWVSASFGPDSSPPGDMVLDGVDESYRAVAPKRLIAQIGAPPQDATADAGASAAGKVKAPAKKKAAKAAAPAKKKAAKAAAPAKKKATKAERTPQKAIKTDDKG